MRKSESTRSRKREQEQAEIRETSLRDLYWQTMGFCPPGRVAVLEAVQDHLHLLDVSYTPEGEKICAEAIAERFRNWDTAALANVCVRGCVRELSNYRRASRIGVLESALVRARDVEAKADQLIKLRPSVLRTYRALPAETKALLLVTHRLVVGSRYVNGGFLDKVVQPVRDEADANVLRDNPKLAVLVDAFDLATQIWNLS